MKVLSGHYDENSAYIVESYPYGFKLRCRCRFYLDVHPKKGTRLVTQTTNPKVGDGTTWNKPKMSTYSPFGAMFLDDEGHVHWSGLSVYDIREKGKSWMETYRSGLTEGQIKELEAYIKLIEKHDAKKAAAEVISK